MVTKTIPESVSTSPSGFVVVHVTKVEDELSDLENSEVVV